MLLHRIADFVIAILTLGYVLGRDVLAGDRSLGKKLMEIRVLTTRNAAIGFMESLKRNGIFAVGSTLNLVRATFQLVPCLGDAVACLMLPLFFLSWLIGIAAVIVEVVKIVTQPDGRRFGDEWAGTRVVR